jgi:hypothetical protein
VRDGLIEAMNYSQHGTIAKQNITLRAAGVPFSHWQVAGLPAEGTTPTAATICTKATPGALLDFTNATGEKSLYMARLFLISSITSTDVQIYDRLAAMGGLSGSLTTSQTVDLSAVGMTGRIGKADYSELAWWAEDRAGLRLLSAFERWAADMGASEVRMTTICGLTAAETILARKGYAPREISHAKVI